MRTRLLVSYVVGSLIFLTGFAVWAAQKTVQEPKRATSTQIDAILAKNPDLSSGLTMPDNAKVKVRKKVPGGIMFDVASPTGATGTITVLPPPTATPLDAKSVIVKLIKIGLELWGGGGDGGGGGGGGGGKSTCTTTGSATTSGGTSTITITSTCTTT